MMTKLKLIKKFKEQKQLKNIGKPINLTQSTVITMISSMSKSSQRKLNKYQ